MNTMTYKDYFARIEYSTDDEEFFGSVVNTSKEDIYFSGKTVAELKKNMREAINGHIKNCKTSGIDPEQPVYLEKQDDTEPEPIRDFKDLHLEELKDPEEARAYLEVAREEYEKDGDREALLLALQDVAEAQGGIGNLAKRTSINPEDLYDVFDLLIISKENTDESYSPHSNQTIL